MNSQTFSYSPRARQGMRLDWGRFFSPTRQRKVKEAVAGTLSSVEQHQLLSNSEALQQSNGMAKGVINLTSSSNIHGAATNILPGIAQASAVPGTHARKKPSGAREGVADHANPQTAINGFISIFLTLLCFFLYVCWLWLPTSVLHGLQIYYYPTRYWAFAVPAMLLMLFFYYIIVSCSLMLIKTYPLTDGRCVTDIDRRHDTELHCGALTEMKGRVAPWTDISASVSSTLLFQPWTE